MPFLSVNNISKKATDGIALDAISFSQQQFEKIAIAGETGSGKTTLLKIIAGLTQTDRGTVYFENEKVAGPEEKLLAGHPSIAYLGQHFELLNNYWVHELLEYANDLTPQFADKLYKLCKIDHLVNRRTNQLSGGERQRIALAKLLTKSPKLLLLDEPFSNLDVLHRKIIRQVIADVSAELQISCILVSHDAADLLSWADTLLVLKDGKVVQQGTPEQVYNQPVSTYCAGLLGDYNLINTAKIQIAGMKTGDVLMIRPEHTHVLRTSTSTMFQGKVINIEFFGSHYLLYINCNDCIIKSRTSHNEWEVNEEVYIRFSEKHFWH